MGLEGGGRGRRRGKKKGDEGWVGVLELVMQVS